MKFTKNYKASMLLFQFKLRRSSTMRLNKKVLAASYLIILSSLAGMAYGQQTRNQAVAAMRKVDAKEMDATYTTAAPFAQQLVNEALAKHPEILLIAIHAAPPGHKNLIVASNFGRIGKIGDEDDMRCVRTGKSNLEVR